MIERGKPGCNPIVAAEVAIEIGLNYALTSVI
jgi:hypothetical protein